MTLFQGDVIGGMLKQCKKDQIVQYKLRVEVPSQAMPQRSATLNDPRKSQIEDQSQNLSNRNTLA